MDMKRYNFCRKGVERMVRRQIVVLMLCCVCGWCGTSRAEDPSDAKAETKDKTRDKTKAAAAPAADRSKDPAVNAWYDRLLESYMKADWTEFVDLYKQFSKMRLKLSPNQLKDVIYMRKTAAEFRPGWWKHTNSMKNKSFKAQIWKRWFTANYVPSETLGSHQPVEIRNKRLVTTVSWRPTYVDNPKPFSNDNSFYVFIPEAKDYDFKLGTMAEVIIWHELGHNYISLNLPLKHVIRLYNEYGLLYSHLQEFYADLTAMYHSSPPGRLFTMRFRLMNMVDYDENNVHTRGCAHAVGALLLSKILDEPEKWPSFHFPGKAPKNDVEPMTIFYLYRHVDPSWTLAEDRQLREFINKWVRTNGESALRRKGRILLPNGQTMMIMAGEDRTYQRKRDQWIKKKLEAIIDAGRADKPDVIEKDMRDIENRVRFVPVKKLGSRDESESRRGKSKRRAKKKTKNDSNKKKQDDDLDDVLDDEDE